MCKCIYCMPKHMATSVCLKQEKESEISQRIPIKYACLAYFVDPVLQMEFVGVRENFPQDKIITAHLFKTGHWVLSDTYKARPHPTQAVKSNGKYQLSLRRELARSLIIKTNCWILLKDYQRLKKPVCQEDLPNDIYFAVFLLLVRLLEAWTVTTWP